MSIKLETSQASQNKEENLYWSWQRDESCNEPILYSVEDDICKFSEWDTSDQKVSNESKSVLCFDSTVEEAWDISQYSQYSALIGTSIQGAYDIVTFLLKSNFMTKDGKKGFKIQFNLRKFNIFINISITVSQSLLNFQFAILIDCCTAIGNLTHFKDRNKRDHRIRFQ